MKLIARLKDQPAPSTFEGIVVFCGLDVPAIMGRGIAADVLGLPEWLAFVVGMLFMTASFLAYIALRREVLSK